MQRAHERTVERPASQLTTGLRETLDGLLVANVTTGGRTTLAGRGQRMPSVRARARNPELRNGTVPIERLAADHSHAGSRGGALALC